MTCEFLSVPRSSFYRWLKDLVVKRICFRPSPRNRIPDPERMEILGYLHDERFIDLTPREIVPALADDGVYLGSIRTFYRVLSENNEVCERRLQARRINHAAPILEARAINQVWSWDITRIKGPYKSLYYFLYVMIDLYSRYVVGWMLSERENARRAHNFIRETVQKHLGPDDKTTIHNDRGSPMKAGTTRELINLLGISQSFSRPRTSDDNPFSESQFRTLKYHHTFPDFFDSFGHAIGFFDQWFAWYNNEHHHTGLNLLRPADVYFGRVDEIIERRQSTLDMAYALHPERFPKGQPIVKKNPEIVGINLKYKANLIEHAGLEMEKVA
jgi:putative transposase